MIPIYIYIFLTLFVPRVKEGTLFVPSLYLMYSTVFGRMPEFESELLRPQPGVLPISYTHPIFLAKPKFSFKINISHISAKDKKFIGNISKPRENKSEFQFFFTLLFWQVDRERGLVVLEDHLPQCTVEVLSTH